MPPVVVPIDSVGNDLNANLDISTAGGSTTTITTAALQRIS